MGLQIPIVSRGQPVELHPGPQEAPQVAPQDMVHSKVWSEVSVRTPPAGAVRWRFVKLRRVSLEICSRFTLSFFIAVPLSITLA